MTPFADHFSRLAPTYATCRPGYPDQLFAYLASLAPRRELAWDCAAGSGQATLGLVNHFNQVVATDLSRSMLDQAPAHRRIEYRVAPAQASGLPAATVDLVTVAQALHWLDISAFYAEVERVLVPGGILAVWTYGAQQLDEPGLERELAHFYSQVVGPFWPPERRHVESGYRTLPFPLPDLQPPAFTMERHWTLPQLLGYVRTWSATDRFREQVGHDPVSRLEEELAAHWGDPSVPRRVRWPLSLRLGRRW